MRLHIKEFRETRNLTQGELCDIVGITRSTLSKYENDKAPINGHVIDVIFHRYKVHVFNNYAYVEQASRDENIKIVSDEFGMSPEDVLKIKLDAPKAYESLLQFATQKEKSVEEPQGEYKITISKVMVQYDSLTTSISVLKQQIELLEKARREIMDCYGLKEE